MDLIRNPFAPGAGSIPPDLAGRDSILEEAHVNIQRALLARGTRPQMLLGLRGVGKTVLLNKIEDLADEAGHLTSMIEAPDGKQLAELLLPKISQVLRKLSLIDATKQKVRAAYSALVSFASTFKVSIGETTITVEPEVGVADSGDLESDLPELFVRIGEAAKAAGKAWTLLIDEAQYLKEKDLSALIVALHKVNQKNLPITFFGAGLPQVAALAGDAKSYAERLFSYYNVGPLNEDDAHQAIRHPIENEGATIDDEALVEIYKQTKGYPYFLQEWGYQCWKIAHDDCVRKTDVLNAAIEVQHRLDHGFFKVRFDRLTPKEREYIIGMSRLGAGPSYRSAEVAEILGESLQSLGPCRASIINKGMIYSPSHGDVAFTVPLFSDYLKRRSATQ